MTTTTRRTGLLLAVLLLTAGAAPAQEGGDDAAMAACMRAATPGPMHEFMAGRAGSWKMETRMWMTPDAEPMASTATSRAEMILGGRYLQETARGVTMGMPFEGLGLTGYDNTTGLLTMVWLDTMGTATTVLSGRAPAPGEPWVLTGTAIDPASGMEMRLRAVTTFTGPDSHTFAYYAAMPGMDETKMMEMDYTRVR